MEFEAAFSFGEAMRLVIERNEQSGNDPNIIEVDSMLTRDFFAGAALSGLVSAGRYQDADEASEKIAADAYWYADAMMKERSR